MQRITLRDLLRNIKSIFPIPAEGIHVVRRDGDDFYIYPEPSTNSTAVKVMSDADVEEVAEAVANKLREDVPLVQEANPAG